jgi:hypothetical protein
MNSRAENTICGGYRQDRRFRPENIMAVIEVIEIVVGRRG